MHDTFDDFGVSREILDAVSRMGFTTPTPVQKAAVPIALSGRDLIGLAQTGTGKTAAFGIPIAERIARGNGKHPAALILVPTRELAIQVAGELGRIGTRKGIVTTAVYGGQPIVTQLKALKKGVDVVVGTPGRVMDHLRRRSLVLEAVETVVLDEADEMLNMGFIDDMETILAHVPEQRQTMLFSATMPQAILRLTGNYMQNPETVRAGAGKRVVAEISQSFSAVGAADRAKALMRILDVEDYSRTLIFCDTKKEVDDLSATLKNAGYAAAGLHGDYPQELRDETMKRFRDGTVDVLVATDVAARGIDIPDITHVVNFGLPQNAETYIHRIGRTGRAGKAGTAVTLITPRETRRLKVIERSAKTVINKMPIPTKKAVRLARQRGIIGGLEKALGRGGHKAFRSLVDELSNRYAPEDVAAAALALAYGDLTVEDIAEPAPSSPGRRGSFEGDFVKIRLTLGKRDGIRVGDLVKSVANRAKIPARNIGKITLHNKHSVVEVPAHLARRTAASLNNWKCRGRIIQAT